jgi:hypothetical protein
MPLPTRLRAAALALPFERPKLAVTAVFSGEGDFALRLDRAVERSRAVRIIEHQPQAEPARTEAVKRPEHPASELGPTLRRRV